MPAHFLAEETMIFLQACLLGAQFGVLYDALRILRLAIRFRTGFVFVQDVLYFMVITLLSFSFLLAFNDGQLRMYILVGQLLGFVVYFFTLGLLVMKLSRVIIKIVRKILWLVFYPFRKLWALVLRVLNFAKNKTVAVWSAKHRKIQKNL